MNIYHLHSIMCRTFFLPFFSLLLFCPFQIVSSVISSLLYILNYLHCLSFSVLMFILHALHFLIFFYLFPSTIFQFIVHLALEADPLIQILHQSQSHGRVVMKRIPWEAAVTLIAVWGGCLFLYPDTGCFTIPIHLTGLKCSFEMKWCLVFFHSCKFFVLKLLMNNFVPVGSSTCLYDVVIMLHKYCKIMKGPKIDTNLRWGV